MLSKAKIKLVRSLAQKKYRHETGLFVAEGPKIVEELLASFDPQLIIATSEWLHAHPTPCECVEVDRSELQRASLLQAPQEVLAVFRMPTARPVATDEKSLVLALDGVQDPGNLGTILRIADWYGIEQIVCSLDTADVYNPKVVQASMGSLARVKVCYVALPEWLKEQLAHRPVYGMVLDGENIYACELQQNGIVVMGNEGNGISDEVKDLLSHRLLIPRYPEGKSLPESLNVAVATAITCAAFRRLGD